MESATIAGGRLLDCPIEEYLDEDGDVMYRVLLADGRQIGYMLGDPMPLEEARAHIRELLLEDIRDGRYDVRLYMDHEFLLADAQDQASYMHHGFGAVPASAEAIADLQEAIEGVCL